VRRHDPMAAPSEQLLESRTCIHGSSPAGCAAAAYHYARFRYPRRRAPALPCSSQRKGRPAIASIARRDERNPSRPRLFRNARLQPKPAGVAGKIGRPVRMDRKPG
jgi:hypothetical protein